MIKQGEYFIYNDDVGSDSENIAFHMVKPKGGGTLHLFHLVCEVDWQTKTVSMKPMLGVEEVDELFAPETEFEDCLTSENLDDCLKGLAFDVCYFLSLRQGTTIESEFNRAISDFLSEKAALQITREDHDKPMIAFYLKIGDLTTRALFKAEDLEPWMTIELEPDEKYVEERLAQIEDDFCKRRPK